MFDIKRAHVLEAIAELAQTAGLPNAELEALKAMKQMKDEPFSVLGHGGSAPNQHRRFNRARQGAAATEFRVSLR